MSSGPPDDDLQPKLTAIEAIALAWVTRCDRGLNAAEETELEAWLNANPRHRAVFEEFNGIFTLVSQAEQTTRTSKVGPVAAQAVESDRHPAPSSRARRMAWQLIPLAAAACLAFGYVAWWRPAYYAARWETAIGEVRTIDLPDGSAVELNTQSVVAVSFRPGERRIQLLQGEGHFKVAKQSGRPFVVAANGVAVEAIGTMFNVRLRSASVDVLVTEGTVQVGPAAEPASAGRAPLEASAGATNAPEPIDAGSRGRGEKQPPVVLTAGHRVSIDVTPAVFEGALRPEPLPQVMSVPADEMRRELAWQDRKLEFESARLEEIVAEMNRYHRRKLVIADAALAGRRFGGSFRADDREGFVRMLQDNFGVVVEEIGTESVIRPGRQPAR